MEAFLANISANPHFRVASISGLPGGPLYGTSKHGVLGLMRSLAPEFELYGWRIAAVTPWFAGTSASATSFERLFVDDYAV